LGFDLDNTVYALDSTTIDLCLWVFPWAHFRSTKAAVKMPTLLDLRGCIPSFIHISEGKLHDVNVLDLLLPEPGAIYVMDRGYLDFSRLYLLHQAAAFFVTRAKSNTALLRTLRPCKRYHL
jgi:Transposase DDE domain